MGKFWIYIYIYTYPDPLLPKIAPLAALSAAKAVSDLELRVPRELRAASAAPGGTEIWGEEHGQFMRKSWENHRKMVIYHLVN